MAVLTFEVDDMVSTRICSSCWCAGLDGWGDPRVLTGYLLEPWRKVHLQRKARHGLLTGWGTKSLERADTDERHICTGSAGRGVETAELSMQGPIGTGNQETTRNTRRLATRVESLRLQLAYMQA